jgi:hypothetical protein
MCAAADASRGDEETGPRVLQGGCSGTGKKEQLVKDEARGLYLVHAAVGKLLQQIAGEVSGDDEL